MSTERWGEREIQDIFIQGSAVQKFENVRDIKIYQEYLGLDIFEEFIVDKFYSPLTDRYYTNTNISEKLDSAYQKPRIHHKANVVLVRVNNMDVPFVQEKTLHVAGLYSGETPYLVANEEHTDDRITPHGYRLKDIVLYQPEWK